MSRSIAALTGVVSTGVATAVLEARPPGGRVRWDRTNYAGRTVSLLGGAVQAAALGATALLTGGRTGRAAAVAAVGAGAMGAVDDLTEAADARHVKGLRGHLGELRRGRVTTGAAKIAGIGTSALLAAAILPRAAGGSRLSRLGDVATSSMLIAGTANLLNLFDLRPGRAAKVTCLLAAPLAAAGGPGGPVAAGTLAVAATGVRDDLQERTMLGDTGANALGAALGTALAAHPCRGLRLGALATVVGLTLLSERVSFSAVIEQVPALRAVDGLGRR